MSSGTQSQILALGARWARAGQDGDTSSAATRPPPSPQR